MQTIGYQILFDFKFLLRSFSLVGALLLILAECRGPANHTVFDLPTLSGDKPKVLTAVPSFKTDRHSELSSTIRSITLGPYVCKPCAHFKRAFGGKSTDNGCGLTTFQLAINLVGIIFIILVAIGFKTKLVSVIMVFWLTILNVAMHDFWSERTKSIKYDFKKYDFFQTLTVTGGLLQLIIHGPGTVSVDETKKAH